MGRFIHIYIRPSKDTTKEALEQKLNLAVDWYKYETGLYVVYTTSTVEKWQERLLNLVKDDGRLFICELQISTKNGWMNKDFWEWIKKPRNK
jgi:hypothetical protein